MPTFKQKRVLKYISDKDTSTLTFDDECVLKEFDKESSLDDLVYKCLYYTNSYYSWVEIYPGMFEIETISGKWRSSLDIWRHVKHFTIEGADRIEGVEVLGWKCVVRKGQFKEGDLCIYIEIDTIIPKYLLTDNLEDKEEIRLKTVKMKGQISQGLILPINILEKYVSHLDIYEDHVEFTDGTAEWKTLGINVDISKNLGIKKYEKPIPLNMQGIIKGNFPGFLRKTDEVKVQSEPSLLE